MCTQYSKETPGEASNMCPIGGTYKLTLSTSLDTINGLHRVYSNADNNTLDDQPGDAEVYKTAIVQQGTWILYENADYNNYKQGDAKFVVLPPGTHLLEFQPRSVRPITSSNAVTLYTHKNFGGRQKVYTTNAATLPEFPIFNAAGVSSIIITPLSKKWRFHVGANYTGSTFDLGPGYYETAKEFFGKDEAIQSIKRI